MKTDDLRHVPKMNASLKSRTLLRIRFASKIGRVVCEAASLVHGHLRIRAQRPGHIDLPVAHVRRDNPIGRLAVFAPALDDRHFIELIVPWPPAQCCMPGIMNSRSQSL